MLKPESWSEQDCRRLAILMQVCGNEWVKIAQAFPDKTLNAVRLQGYSMKRDDIVPQSTMPLYNEPLTVEGDALIMSDIEAPYHHAAFINQVIELALSWKIKRAIVAGDYLHMNCLSSWEPHWSVAVKNGLTDKQERDLVDFIKSLSKRQQQRGFDLLTEWGEQTSNDGKDISQELDEVRKVTKVISTVFDELDFILGNHEGRALRSLECPMYPDEILTWLDLSPEHKAKWQVRPYYFCYLNTPNGQWLIEHPKTCGEHIAIQLADKYQCHVACAHNHQQSLNYSRSGKLYAISTGCMVDETRLAYAAQRHTTGKAHVLGALIIRDGQPYLLNEHTDFEMLKRIGA